MDRAACSGKVPFSMFFTRLERWLGASSMLVAIGMSSLVAACERPPPPGVECSDHVSCAGVDNPCSDCLVVPGCGPICIPASEACELSCPAPTECAILESFPAQIQCKDLVPGFGEPTQPAVFGC